MSGTLPIDISGMGHNLDPDELGEVQEIVANHNLEISMRTTTEEAKQIRQTLKKRGITPRQVSVRTQYYSMGSSIHVEIKDPDVVLEPVEAIANRAERISRDEVTGEILNGGNTYVSVRYSRDAEKALAARFMPQAEKAIGELESHGKGSSCIVPVTDRLAISWSQSGWAYQTWRGDRAGCEVSGAEGVALAAARAEDIPE